MDIEYRENSGVYYVELEGVTQIEVKRSIINPDQVLVYKITLDGAVLEAMTGLDLRILLTAVKKDVKI